jgi:glycosyltransferase involved in cell wall biosynthesis
MNEVRIHGDPFGEDPAAGQLRSFLRLCLGSGMRCALSLDAVQARAPGPGEPSLVLSDGVRSFAVATRLPPAEVDLLVRAAGEAVAATAPLLVFGPPEQLADQAALAGFAWPRAAAVLPVRPGVQAGEVLSRVRAELRWAGVETPAHALSERELAPWLALPAPAADGAVVHVGHGAESGTDLAVAAWQELGGASWRRLVLVVGAADDAAVAALRAAAPGAELVRGPFDPAQVRAAAVVCLPWRQCRETGTLVRALASGRPVVASRWSATASLLDRPGTCHPVGGQLGAVAGTFEADLRAVVAALRAAGADAAVGARARAFVREELVAGRPAAPPVPSVRRGAATRPRLVLEAPLFETSSSAELTLATAQALVARGVVDVQLVPSGPCRGGLAALRQRAPELLPHLVRNPSRPDLWLSSGWPVRAARPDCRTWGLRVDFELGALPVALTPHVDCEADLVVVHSDYTAALVEAAGRPSGHVHVVPHGVDAALHESVAPDPRIVAWKGARPAVLFCGGMIWRKGFDLFLRTVLAARAAGADFAVVVKAVGSQQHYGGQHLGELLERCRRTPGTPPILLVEEELDRPALASLYTACDVLLHPYRGEGFGLPILEARACGLPVLASGGGGADAQMHGPGAVALPAARRPVALAEPMVGAPWVLEAEPEAAAAALGTVLGDLPRWRAAARAEAAAVRAAFAWSSAAARLEGLAQRAAAEPTVVLAPTRPPAVVVG